MTDKRCLQNAHRRTYFAVGDDKQRVRWARGKMLFCLAQAEEEVLWQGMGPSNYRSLYGLATGMMGPTLYIQRMIMLINFEFRKVSHSVDLSCIQNILQENDITLDVLAEFMNIHGSAYVRGSGTCTKHQRSSKKVEVQTKEDNRNVRGSVKNTFECVCVCKYHDTYLVRADA